MSHRTTFFQIQHSKVMPASRMDNPKECSTLGVVSFWTLFLLVKDTSATIICPNISIERGSTYVISCNSEKTLVDFYWYKGVTSRSTPILRLENGQKGGSEEGSEHFGILSNGSMKINNAVIDQESYYTLIGYYDRENFDSATFLVNITVSPDPPCPVVNQCDNCTVCHIKAEGQGTLICSITRSRPFVPLAWNFIHQDGVSFTKHREHNVPEDETSPMNTSISLDYTLDQACGVDAFFQCVSTGSSNILQSNVTSINITTDPCIPPTSLPAEVNTFVFVISGAVIAFVILFCVISYWIYHRSKTVEFLRSCLRETYEKHCYVKPLPWGEDISISALHTSCKCTITNKDEHVLSVSTEELLSLRHIGDEKRVIFIGDLGYGKTTFTKQMVHQWIQDRSNEYLLIYILLKDVKKEMKVSDIVMAELPSDRGISVADIEETLKENKCLIILDGLDEMSLSFDVDMGSAAPDNEIGIGDGLAISEVLQGFKRQTYTGMRVWVTSREVDNTKSPFPKPYLKVQMNGFSKDQIKTYIKKCCRYYLSRGERSFDITNDPSFDHFKLISKLSEKAANTNITSSNGMNEEILVKESSMLLDEQRNVGEDNEIAEIVEEFFEINDLFNDFAEAPLLLILMVHIMSAKFTGAISHYNTLVITRVSTLVGMVITSLESRFFQKLDTKSASDKIVSIEDKLGKVAFDGDVELSVKGTNFWIENIQNDNLEIALGIGLLKQSKRGASESKALLSLASSSFTGIEFYHRCIQEYCAARYIVDNHETFPKLKAMINKYKTDENFGLLKFVCGFEKAPIKAICNALLKQEMFNNLIDCLYEAGVHNVDDKVYQTVGSHSIRVANLDKKYHRDAVRFFCKQFKNLQITVESITFFSDCHVWYLKTLHLPRLKSLTFFRAQYTDLEFKAIIHMFSSQKVTETLWFVECKVPEKLGDLEDSFRDLKRRSGITIKRKRNEMDLTFSSFDFELGEWKLEVKGVLSAPIEFLSPQK
ncbi:hypothetical protein HOLleu_22184 [Holothuria leucospilota]|uniref:NACHT domain-containing protein n=1 Tax=Holothuria leucospilota TaxID=206669 RepID=A0A9Q1H7B1_HOLLE|nr:hypothetical protein HOLleu_22184 [Holothuria leucospilota]